MSLVLITGAVRSGKSSSAETLAASTGAPVTVAVAGWDGDEEMARRIDAHRAARPSEWAVLEAAPDPAWVTGVPADRVLLLDCLTTLIGTVAWEAAGDSDVASRAQEEAARARTDALVAALLSREGDTVVVSNEAGWGVVPPTAAGRLFRDLTGRANRALTAGADAAYLVVAGRFIDLKAAAGAPSWPATD